MQNKIASKVPLNILCAQIFVYLWIKWVVAVESCFNIHDHATETHWVYRYYHNPNFYDRSEKILLI